MRIVLATNNKGKIEEFTKLLENIEVIPFSQILGSYEVIEDGLSFKENSVKKAKEIYSKIDDENSIVIADDSGISVEALNGEPGIYSARYAGLDSNDEDNNKKIINELEKLSLKESKAFYTACISIVYKNQVFTMHGWMHGKITTKSKGSNGFGYDPLFIPNGFDKTLGELPLEIKKAFSHRSKALVLAKKVLEVIL